MSATVYDIWLSLHTTPETLWPGKLLEIFGDAYGVYRASDEELIFADVGRYEASALEDHSLDRAFDILRFCERKNILLYRPGDQGYPKALEKIKSPPRMLYVCGTLPDMDENVCVGMVGTRKMSGYGMEQAYRISYELASAGAVIVSGMARGIDGVSAVAAMEAGGKTVAVVGTGINVVFPQEHAVLAREIAKNGAIVSEYPPDTEGESWRFPQRNRIINGMSDGVCVVEAGKRSGAIITANDAFDEGRHVFAVPGNLGNPNNIGSNLLMRRGALPILGAEDIIELLNGTKEKSLDETRFAEATLRSSCDIYALQRYGVSLPEEIPVKRIVNHKTSEQSVQAAADSGDGAQSSENREPPEGRMREIWKLFPDGQSVSPDFFTQKGYRIGEAMNLLSMLEISGFVRGVPGGMYIKI